MRAVILAGGEGTRLRPLTLTRPKPMLPLGPTPVIEHLVTHLSKIGFDNISITLSYLSDQIMNHLGDGSDLGVKINYSVEPEGLFLGTAGSVKMISHLLSEPFVVVQGDTYTEMDLRKAVDLHRNHESVATILLKRVSDPWLFGVTLTDGTGRITGFQEKPLPHQCKGDRISTGIYVLEPEALDFISKGYCDFARDVFPRLLRVGREMFGCELEGFWVDVGSLEGYLKGVGHVLEHLEGPREGEANTNVEGEAWIGQKVAIDEAARIVGPSLIENLVKVGKGAQVGPYAVVKNGSSVGQGTVVEKAVLLEGASVGANGAVRASVVGEKASLGNSVKVERAVVGQGCLVKNGVRICPNSRIWPSVVVEDDAVVESVLVVSLDKPFYFYTDIGRYTGMLVTSIEGLIEVFRKVDVKSLEFHLSRRDLERWIRDVIQEPTLAENTARLRKRGLEGEMLRQKLIRMMEDWWEYAQESGQM